MKDWPKTTDQTSLRAEADQEAPGIRRVRIVRMRGRQGSEASPGREVAADLVAVEEPLEIRLGFDLRGQRVQKAVSITMRTPGHDFELAAGFLHGEAIVADASQIAEIRHCASREEGESNPNVVRVELADGVEVDLGRLQRHFYTTSSCGVCGKTSLEALEFVDRAQVGGRDLRVSATLICGLPERLRAEQEVFESTGGLHAAAFFDAESGEIVALREDVGRHNALDKLIGACIFEGQMPMEKGVLVLSGRASFELLQKAKMAGVPIVAAVGAPSSLAVDLAERFGITLLGFVREGRFNAYTHPERLLGC